MEITIRIGKRHVWVDDDGKPLMKIPKGKAKQYDIYCTLLGGLHSQITEIISFCEKITL